MTEVEEYFDLFFYRPLAFILVKLIYRTNITPNQLTLVAIVFGVLAGFAFAHGTDAYCMYGAILFMLYNVFDCSDGMVARLKKNGTRVGRIIDGFADYIATGAVYIGLIIGHADHHFSVFWWVLLLVFAAVSNIITCILIDYYRNRFLDYVLQRKSTFEEDMKDFRAEYEAVKKQEGRWFDKLILRIYLKYSAFQGKLLAKQGAGRQFQTTPEEYYRKNRTAVRWWVMIGPTAQITVIMICSLIHRFDLFFWIIIGLFNIVAMVNWIAQRRIDKSFELKVSTVGAQQA